MRRGKKPSQFIPAKAHSWVFGLSKAALADIAWNLASACVESAEDLDEVERKLASEAAVTLGYRGDAIPEAVRAMALESER